MLTMSDELKREIRKKAGEADKSMNQYILDCVIKPFVFHNEHGITCRFCGGNINDCECKHIKEQDSTEKPEIEKNRPAFQADDVLNEAAKKAAKAFEEEEIAFQCPHADGLVDVCAKCIKKR